MAEERGFDYNQLIAPGVGAVGAFAGSIPQLVEANRLRKERERLLKEGAPGMSPIEQEQLAAARARAASTLAPGYGTEMENIAEQQSNILGAAKKAGITGSNIMNTLSRLNQQGQAARRNLVIRGAQTQRAAQGDLADISMSADARRQNRVQNWEAKLAAMDAARRQYNAQAGMSPIQGAMAFMPAEGFKMGTGAVKPTAPETTPSPYKSFADIPNKFSETEPMYNPYAAQSGAGMRMAPQTSDMGAGATPPPMNLMRPPSMMAAPQNQMEEAEFEPNMEAFNPILNTSIRRTYRPSRFPNTRGIESPIRTNPYYNFRP